MTGRDLERAFLNALRPPRRQTVSEWADENRVLVSESSSAPGRWRTQDYQKEIMDAFTDSAVQRIVLMWGAQVGKTEIMLNCMMYSIAIDPGPIAYVNATTLFSEDFSKRRFAPAVRVCEPCANLIADVRSRDSSNTITMKTFPGGSAAFLGASSPVELAGRPIRYVFGDEIDRWPRSAGTEGDPIKLIERRAETFRGRKLIYVSTPTVKGDSRIEKEFLLGTQEELTFACPGCGALHPLEFKQIIYDHTRKTAPAGGTQFKIRNIRWHCPDCGGAFDERTVKAAPVFWQAAAPEALKERATRSFHMNAFLSPWARWQDIVREYLEAGKDRERLQVFYNTRLGEAWQDVDMSSQVDVLFMRREIYGCDVPEGVKILTCGVDTQDNRLEYEVVGWGGGDESWGIRRGILPGRPDTDAPWDALEELLKFKFVRADGAHMGIRCTFMDSGGHFTQEVYQRTHAMQRRGIKIFAIFGREGADKAYVTMSRKQGAGLIFQIGVDSGKAAIMYAASIDEPGEGYMHFPRDAGFGYERDYFSSLLSEKMGLHVFRGRQRMGWHKIYERNEALDCRNYARAAYKGFDWHTTGQERDARAGAHAAGGVARYISRGIKV